MKTSTPYILGLDCGQTALKVCVFDICGNELYSVSAPTGISNSSDGISSKLDMELLWKKTCSLLREITQKVSAAEICAVGVSGHGNGIYPIDAEGKAFMPAVLSTDLNALSVISAWNSDGTASRIRQKTLCTPWAGQPAPILKYLSENFPQLFKRIRFVLSCADWLTFRLTGILSTDFGNLGTSGLIDQRKGITDNELSELYGIPSLSELIPCTFASGRKIGGISKQTASETGLIAGTPVSVGNFDVNACCIGGGAVDYSHYSVVAGTWSINAAFTNQPVISESLFSCNLYGDGKRYISIESSPTSAINLELFLKAHPDLAPADCDILVEAANWRTPEDILYLPYVKPLPTMPWLKGGFSGNISEKRLPDKLRILYEGVAMGHRLHIENLKSSGLMRDAVRITGGAAKSRIWMQMFADIIGLPIEVPNAHSAGALGAAICAGVSAGMYKSIEEACSQMIAVKNVFYPMPDREEFYSQRFSRFLNLIKAQNTEI